MSDTMQSLDQLASLKTASPEAPKYVKKVDKYGRAYACLLYTSDAADE